MELLLTVLTLSLLVAAFWHIWSRSKKNIFIRLFWTLVIFVCPILGAIIYFLLAFRSKSKKNSAHTDFPSLDDHEGIGHFLHDKCHLVLGKAIEKHAPRDIQENLENIIDCLKDFYNRGLLTYDLQPNYAYIGEMEDGKYDGIGIFAFTNGYIYIGTLEEGQCEGWGFHYSAKEGWLDFGAWHNGNKVEDPPRWIA